MCGDAYTYINIAAIEGEYAQAIALFNGCLIFISAIMCWQCSECCCIYGAASGNSERCLSNISRNCNCCSDSYDNYHFYHAETPYAFCKELSVFIRYYSIFN